MPTEEPKKPQALAGLNKPQTTGVLPSPLSKELEHTNEELKEPGHALQVYWPQTEVLAPYEQGPVTRSRQAQLQQAQQTLLALTLDYFAIVVYLM